MVQKIVIIIDARMVTEHIHGIARYTYEIIRHMSTKDNIEMILLVNDLNLANSIFGKFENIKFIKMRSKFLSLLEQIELPLVINKYKNVAIFHTPSFVASPFIKCKMVMTIHDLNHIKFPQYYTPFHKYYYKYIVKPCALKSKKIFTVSEFSKQEIVKWLNCKESKVQVTYNGIDGEFNITNNNCKLEEVKKRYKLPSEFILYIGNLKPHKNVETLVKAMRFIDSGIKLVINGRPNNSLTKLIKELKLESKIQFIGYVHDDDLPIMYNLCNVFVFPSIYEGFGLPPLEAIACGAKVVVSNIPSLHEIVGGYAIEFNPFDAKELADKICEALTKKKNFIGVNDYIKKFLWKNCANKTLKTYFEICDNMF